MPADFTPGSDAAFVDMGVGANAPQIRFTADDESCIWNGFPIRIIAPSKFPSGGGVAPSTQRSAFVTPIPSGGSPTLAEWPEAWVYSPLGYALRGETFAGSVSFTSDGSGTVTVSNPLTGGSFSGNFTGGGAHTISDPDITFPDCAQIGCPNLAIPFRVTFVPFNVFVPITITGGSLVLTPNGDGDDSLLDDIVPPCQGFGVTFNPPGIKNTGNTLGTFLDDSASPPSANWTNEIVPGDDDITNTAVAQAAASTGAHGTAYWSERTFASDQEVFAHSVTVPTGTDALWVFLNLTNPGTSSVCGYALKIVHSGAMTLYRIDNGSLTSIGSGSSGHTLADSPAGTVGYGIALRRVGDVLKAFEYHPGTVGSGGDGPCGPGQGDIIAAIGFDEVFEVTDDTYEPRASYIGLGMDGTSQRAQLFGGGNYASTRPGLYVCLESTSCGLLTKTYNQIRDAVNALDLGITATILGHGSDTAQGDYGELAGADCSGAIYKRLGKAT